jgi:exodeoxyribonuclease VII small subunit
MGSRERTGTEARQRRTSEERSVPRERTEDTVTDEQPTTTYEQAREELADVVRRLEAGGLTLEESLGLWERGEQLAELCQHWLDRARERLAAATPRDQPE